MSAGKAGTRVCLVEPREAQGTLTCPRDPGWGRPSGAQALRSRPQDSRSSPVVSAATGATPRFATSRWTAQVRGEACEGRNERQGRKRELRWGRDVVWGGAEG